MSGAWSRLIVLGRIGAPYGTRGWVRVNSFTAPAENLLSYERWLLNCASGWQAVKRVEQQYRAGRLLVRFEGCETLDQAAELRNTEIGVDAAQLPALAEGEYYWEQLMGLCVYSRSADGPDRRLGRVKRMIETGANDVMVVVPDESSLDARERLIPWLMGSIVVEVDLERARILIDWDPDY